MRALIRYIVPLSYVFGTRLNDLRSVAGTGYMEWVPSVLIIWWFTEAPVWQVPLMFAAGWVAFTSFYELGYLMNDLYTTQFEEDPRERSDAEPTAVSWVGWIAVRLAAFCGIGWWFGWFAIRHWWVLFAVLAPVYLAHNLFESYEPKVFTFVGLATVRFLAPSAPFLEASEMALLLFPIFVNYVFYRTISYADSKDLLEMPSRQTAGFRVKFYAVLVGPMVVASVVEWSWVPVMFSGYYLAFWLGALVWQHLSG